MTTWVLMGVLICSALYGVTLHVVLVLLGSILFALLVI